MAGIDDSGSLRFQVLYLKRGIRPLMLDIVIGFGHHATSHGGIMEQLQHLMAAGQGGSVKTGTHLVSSK
ncbi:hypothetical protein [Halomonas salinarum]|uniref:hypothetical protein n=1 Tax=Halomonas salinarum TaxID=1158993 RepID=UPI00143BE17C|nr:hypothetical protein [Halomonas salinarum]